MTLRFSSASALCVVLASLVGATAAQADTGYYPFYDQNRDSLQFATVAAPVQNNVVQPVPPSSPATNWQKPSTVFHDQEAAILAPTLPLGTRSGLDGGIQASYYHYDTTPDTQQNGPMLGIIGAATVVSPTGIFDTLDARYAYGRVDYDTPSGSSSDHANSLWDIRDVVGQDFIWEHYALSPYIGVGYRNLYNDNRGFYSYGNYGYQTESQYLYIPIGVKPEVRIDGSTIIRMNAEFDYLAHGWETTHLNNTGDGDPTVHTGQGTGLGFRGEAMWDTGTWAFGPFINYWGINNSASKIYNSPNSTCGAATCAFVDPRNTTIEGGLQLKYHFLSF